MRQGTQYEIRSRTGFTVLSTNDEELARLRLSEMLLKVPHLRLFKVTLVETELHVEWRAA